MTAKSVEWHEARRTGLGGSDIAAIAGMSTRRSPYHVWLSKLNLAAEGEADFEEAAHWGNVLEEPVAQEYATRAGVKVRKKTGLVRDKQRPYLIGNVDRIIIPPSGQHGILEVKTTGMSHPWTSGQPTDAAMLQLQHYLGITGLPWGAFAALVMGGPGGVKMVSIEVQRDDDMIESIRRLAETFWHYVTTGNPPPPDGSERYSEALKKRFPQALTAEQYLLPDEVLPIVEEYDTAAEALRKAEQAKRKAEQELQAAMEDHAVGIIGDRKISWTNVETNRFDSKAFREAHPELYDQFVRPSQSRRFTVR
jgi:putative phage-type endonuclease